MYYVTFCLQLVLNCHNYYWRARQGELDNSWKEKRGNKRNTFLKLWCSLWKTQNKKNAAEQQQQKKCNSNVA